MLKYWMCAAVALVGGIAPCHAGDFRLGETVSEFSLTDTKGQTVTYSPSSGEVTVVIFFSTRCPLSNAFNYRRNTLYNEFNGRARFLIIDPNANESSEEIAAYAREVGFDFPVLRDINNVVADRFGAAVTTDTFVIDAAGVLRYRGYFEDAPNPSRTRNPALRLAIEAVLSGNPVPTPETKGAGCAIRRSRP